MPVGDFTGFINHAPTDHGLQDLNVRDLLGGNIERRCLGGAVGQDVERLGYGRSHALGATRNAVAHSHAATVAHASEV